MAKSVVVACLLLLVFAAAFLGARRSSDHAPSEALTRPPEPKRAESAPSAANDDAVRAVDKLGERSSAVKRMLSSSISSRIYVEQLVAKGLSLADSESVVQTLVDGLAECHFEATRRRYEIAGVTLEQFLNGAEEIWSSTPVEYRNLPVYRIGQIAPQCVAQAAQQAGITIAVDPNRDLGESGPEDFGILGAPNLLTEPSTQNASLGWASQMETRLRNHIERYPIVGVTDLRIKCEERGCIVLMGGAGIQIFAFDFDRFAEDNGFSRVLPTGDESRRFVWFLK